MLLQTLPLFVCNVYYFGYGAHNQNKYCSSFDSFTHTFTCFCGSTLGFTIAHFASSENTAISTGGSFGSLVSKVQLVMCYVLGYKLCIGNLNIKILTYLGTGVCVCYLQNRMWRKSRSQHGNNKCTGTDMNRNFDAGWCGKMMFVCTYTQALCSMKYLLQ